MKSFLQNRMLLLVTAMLFTGNMYAQTWVAETSGTTNKLWRVKFVDANNGYACGDSGTVVKTTNGGTTWSSVNISTMYPVRDIYFVSATEGWAAVGDVDSSANSGEIWHTTNGGTTWTAQTPSTTEARLGISMVDANTGWAVGSKNGPINIDATTNGGTLWNNQTDNNIFGWLYKCDAVSTATAYAIGVTFFPSATGFIIKTTDGGANWAQNTTGTISNPNDIDMIDSAMGFVTGDGGMILATINGGTNWNPRTSGTSDTLMGVSFSAASNGWICGFSGTIIHTTDSGMTWAAETSGTSDNLNGVFALDTTTAWAVGDNGTIKKRTTGAGVNNVAYGRVDCRIYPNPFNNTTTLSIPNSVQLQDAVLYLYDATGKVVMQQNISAHSATLHRGHIAAGTYSYGIFNAGKNIAIGNIIIE